LSIESTLILLVLLIISLSVHEAAHAWTADRLGDPTARMLGRLTLNPLAHIDWIGTVLFPLIAIYSGVPLLGWAKPVPVNGRNLRHPRRDFAIVAAAGPISNLIQAVIVAIPVMLVGGWTTMGDTPMLQLIVVRWVELNVLLAVFNMIPIPPLDGGNVLAGLLPYRLAVTFNQIRPYGFLVLYALILTGGFEYLVVPPYRMIVSWLPTQ
jgi:Zn-dependent protease